LATRSVRDGASVLIWAIAAPTTISAIVVSSGSPLQWLTTAPQGAAGLLNDVQGLGERPDLIEVDEDRVR
jgi:hypothetical protein